MYRVLSLFSGIGGFDLGLERAGGFKTVAFCEIEEYPRRILAKHWPGVPIYHDVRDLTADRLAADGIAVDVICGGFPCQNVSRAGSSWGVDSGLDGDRSGLYHEYARLIDKIRPRWAIIENVDSLLGNGLDDVLRSLAAIGYDAEWDVLPGHSIGAPQRRQRIWIAAYPRGERMEGLFKSVRLGDLGSGWPGGAANLFDVCAAALVGSDSFPQPLLRGVDDRPANWVDRVRACGNAVIPDFPELIGRAILEADQMRKAA